MCKDLPCSTSAQHLNKQHCPSSNLTSILPMILQSLGCDCDPGYGAYDCSERMCPYGIDPLFIDDENTARVPSWSIHFEDAAGILGASGDWRLRLYDVYGEDWITESISLNATCDDVVAELESIPNDFIDDGTVDCEHKATTTLSKYEVTFTGNPGYLRVPEIIILDEAGRHTLRKSGVDAYTGLDTTAVYDTGVTGEFHDFFASRCGVTITASDLGAAAFGATQKVSVVDGTLRNLKECLGDSNGVSSDNVGVENWDYGADTEAFGYWETATEVAYPNQYPHIVKLVNDASSSEFEGGVFAIMFWNSDDSTFYLSNAVDTSLTYQVNNISKSEPYLYPLRNWHISSCLGFAIDESGGARTFVSGKWLREIAVVQDRLLRVISVFPPLARKSRLGVILASFLKQNLHSSDIKYSRGSWQTWIDLSRLHHKISLSPGGSQCASGI